MAGSRNKSPLSGKAPGKKKEKKSIRAELGYSGVTCSKKITEVIPAAVICPARQKRPFRGMDIEY